MKDKMSVSGNSNQPPVEFTEYLYTLIEEIIVKGESFDKYIKWLKKYCNEYGINYSDIKNELTDFVELADEYKSKQSGIIKKILYKTGEKMFFAEEQITNIITLSKSGEKSKLSEMSDDIIWTDNKFGYFTDKRDGKKYKTVKIGEQVWMAENLAFKTKIDSWAFNNNKSYVKVYGYLYNWETAKKACPKGWHLPSEEEFNELINNLGGDKIAGKKLKSTSSLWAEIEINEATNESGFSALPGGIKDTFDHYYYDLGGCAYFWSITQDKNDNNRAEALRLFDYSGNVNDGDTVEQSSYPKFFGVSIRCIRDETIG